MKIALKVTAPIQWIRDRVARDKHFAATVRTISNENYVVVDQHFSFIESAAKVRDQLLKDFSDLNADREISLILENDKIVTLFQFAVEGEARLHSIATELVVKR